MQMDWLTPQLAMALMYLGVVPAIANIYLLWEERYKPGIIWFILAMGIGGAWSTIWATFTLIPHPGVTLALANFLWVLIPGAAVAMFLTAYEFVFKQTVSRGTVAVLFSPLLLLFVLSWFNPYELVFTAAYGVDANGFLTTPSLDGPVKIAVTKVYGYLLVTLAAGMFVGEAMRTKGPHRQQVLSLLTFLSVMVLTTIVKVFGPLPTYFDPTPVIFSLAGFLFVISIQKGELLKLWPIAREQTFQETTEAILVVDPRGRIIDANDSAIEIFGDFSLGQSVENLLSEHEIIDDGNRERVVRVENGERNRVFSLRTSQIVYGRGLEGGLVVLNEITALKDRETELNLLKQILTRVLRHNIRNDLNIISGNIEVIQEKAENEEIIYRAEKIAETADNVVDYATKGRQIERVIARGTPVERLLSAEVKQVRESPEMEANASITTDVADVLVTVHPEFKLAIRELIDNAVSHHPDPENAAVTVTTEVDSEEATLIVEDNGAGLPATEIEMLEAEEETVLEHSSGIGLWLVRWIVSRSGGELLAERTETGTRISIRLQRAEQNSA